MAGKQYLTLQATLKSVILHEELSLEEELQSRFAIVKTPRLLRDHHSLRG